MQGVTWTLFAEINGVGVGRRLGAAVSARNRPSVPATACRFQFSRLRSALNITNIKNLIIKQKNRKILLYNLKQKK